MATTQPDKTDGGKKSVASQLDSEQVLKASSALLAHIRKEASQQQSESTKKSLLSGDDASSNSSPTDTPIWLTLTTKKHIVSKSRLKPSKISVPHSLNPSSNLSICLIVADPQRAVKDVLQDPSFPPQLSTQITRVIGLSKLLAKYKSYESRRQLLATHDLFLADDRILPRLVGALGKTFYKETRKRPIPVLIAHVEKDSDGKRSKPTPSTSALSAGLPQHTHVKRFPNPSAIPASLAPVAVIAKELHSAISCVPVTLKPGTSASLRVGRADFTPEQLAENVGVVVQQVVERFVEGGWRNIKGVHVKGPETSAMPVWLARELWVEGGDVVRDLEGGEGEGEGEMLKKKKKREREEAGGQHGGRSGESNGRKKKRSAVEELRQRQILELDEARKESQEKQASTATALKAAVTA